MMRCFCIKRGSYTGSPSSNDRQRFHYSVSQHLQVLVQFDNFSDVNELAFELVN